MSTLILLLVYFLVVCFLVCVFVVIPLRMYHKYASKEKKSSEPASDDHDLDHAEKPKGTKSSGHFVLWSILLIIIGLLGWKVYERVTAPPPKTWEAKYRLQIFMDTKVRGETTALVHVSASEISISYRPFGGSGGLHKFKWTRDHGGRWENDTDSGDFTVECSDSPNTDLEGWRDRIRATCESKVDGVPSTLVLTRL